jgi:hypothetical protein
MKELQQKLLLFLGERISSYGFNKRPYGQSFIKLIPGGKISFHLAFIAHKIDFDVTADIAIRFDDLEYLVNLDNKVLSKKEKESTYSLGVELGNLCDGKQKRWNVSSEDELPVLVDQLIQYFEKYAVPYFEKYSIKQNAYALLSNNDQTAWIHCPVHSARAKRAVALALLLGYKDSIPNLIKQNVEFLRQKNDFGLKDFISFSDTLNVSNDEIAG